VSARDIGSLVPVPHNGDVEVKATARRVALSLAARRLRFFAP